MPPKRIGMWMCFAFAVMPAAPPGADGEAPPPAPLEARTEWTRSDGRFGLLVEGTTQFPLLVGGRLELELPGRIRLGGEGGVTPHGYFDLAQSVAVEVGADADDVGRVRQTVDDGWGARAFLSWSPFGRSFYLSLGYSYTSLDGQLTSGEVLERVDSPDLDRYRGTARMHTELHGLTGELGVRFYVDHFIVRLSAGVSGTLDARSRIDTDLQGDLAAAAATEVEQWARRTETDLDATLEAYGIIPTVGLGIGYDFRL